MSSPGFTNEVCLKPSDVHSAIEKNMLRDGYDFVVDLEKSKGTILHDALTGREYLDFFTFFASSPLGFNHPRLTDEQFLERLARVAVNKVSNSDLYTVEMAEFVSTFSRIAVPPDLHNLFFISGGALAVENALKAAFDWKVQKNFARGIKEEKGSKVIHFKDAFHGRTGYTMSLTNTDPTKIKYFPKFNWPRVENPRVTFPVEEHLDEIVAAEKRAVSAIEKVLAEDGDDIAAIIIEPIQGEGGDNHFRPEFLKALRRIADENEVILIFDEVQTGVGMTGRMWCFQSMGVQPDIVAFGKKTQVCGIMASDRLNEVESVFRSSGRINSTWGGNIVDMYRSKRIFEIIEEENLVENAARMGEVLQKRLIELQDEFPEIISNARGRGLFCAFDLPDGEKRDDFCCKMAENNMLALKCGQKTVRFRPPLIVSEEEINRAAEILRKVLQKAQ